MLAVARPVPRSQHHVGDLAQTGASVARVDRMKRMKPFRELKIRATRRNRRCEGTDHGKPRLQMVVIREVETQGCRASQDGAVYDVEPDGEVTPIDQQMLVDIAAEHADRGVGCVEDARAGGRDGSSADGDHARVRDRRPDRSDGGAAVPRVFRESAAPSPRRTRDRRKRQRPGAPAGDHKPRDRPDRDAGPPTPVRTGRPA